MVARRKRSVVLVLYVLCQVGVPVALAINARTGIATMYRIYQHIKTFGILTLFVVDIKYLNNFMQTK